MIAGANQKYIVALLNISHEAWQALLGLHRSPRRVHSVLEQEINRVTKGLAPHCRPATFFVTHTPFSVTTGELTGNLKLRRSHILNTYHDQFENLYKGDRSHET